MADASRLEKLEIVRPVFSSTPSLSVMLVYKGNVMLVYKGNVMLVYKGSVMLVYKSNTPV